MRPEDLPPLPSKPGIYQYLSAEQEILYIGKAKNLRSRVKSYFTGTQSTKTTHLLKQATTLKTITTRTEVEALLLENQLIQEHKPKYNILLRNNRRYAWIVVTNETYPRILTARNKKRRGEYFGPYTDGTARRNIILTLNKTFKLRTCKHLPDTVCLQYHINNCAGPCEGHISQEEYAQRIQDAKQVLKGNTRELKQELRKRMQEASKKQRYEQAKQYRDAIHNLDELEQRQVVERETRFDQDVIASTSNQEEAAFAVIHVRNGVLRKKHEFNVPTREGITEEFLTAYYREKTPPKEIITHGINPETAAALEEYFSEQTTSTVTITLPKRGDKKKLLALAQENAQLQLNQENKALTSLEEHLNLPATPTTIDCFDVSNQQASFIVAACTRYRNAKPEPTKYRRFKITSTQLQDDYAGIQEAVTRRYKEGDLPDLIVIDGGKGQLNAAMKGLEANNLQNPIISLAKQEEEVYVPGLRHPLPIKQKDPGLLLLRRIRDATHRFAIKYHRQKRATAMTSSALDHIQGLGPKRKQALYKQFKTYKNIQQASQEELQAVLGEKIGAQVHQELNN